MRTTFRALKSTIAIVTIAILLVATVLTGAVTVFAANSRANGRPAATPDPIVGFWYFTFTAEGNASGPPDGTLIDWGLQQWHSDGTEIMNSATGPKKFCLGVWSKGTGPNTYELNHFPLAYIDATTLRLVQIQAKVSLSRDHTMMTGTFTFDMYKPDGTPVQHVAGDVAGHRITTASPVQDILPPTS